MAYTITNFRNPNFDISSAEYIKKTETGYPLNMNKTHGLGSGLYGIVPNANNARKGEVGTPITLTKPLVLDTDQKDHDFSLLSIWLIELAEAVVQGNQTNKARLLTEKTAMESICTAFGIMSTGGLIGALNRFIKAYQTARPGDFVRQPINYLLEPQFDGIYNSSPNGNNYNRGSVSFQNINPRHQRAAFDPVPPSEKGKLTPGNKLIIGGKSNKKTKRRKTKRRKTRK